MPKPMLGPTGLIAVLMTVGIGTAARAQDMTVTLLGTGSPPPVMNRFGPSILVEVGGRKFLFDAGRGAQQRLMQLRVRWQDIDGVFFTHLHSDHVVGFPDLWLTGWAIARNRPLSVWGPHGTKAMLSHLAQAFAFDIDIRQSDEKLPPDGIILAGTDIGEGVAYDQDGIKVTAFEVDHGPVKPAFGYRIDYHGRSVVLSGDTRVSENLIRYAKGVDLLVHEVAVPETLVRAGVGAERTRLVLAHHVTPEEAGEVFARTAPRLAVYSHIVLPGATEQDVMAATRTKFAGPLQLGEDLMVITVWDSVQVRRPGRTGGAPD